MKKRKTMRERIKALFGDMAEDNEPVHFGTSHHAERVDSEVDVDDEPDHGETISAVSGFFDAFDWD